MKRKKILDRILPIEKYDCTFRLVEEEDAEFIISLRTDKKLSKYINPTSNKIEDQIDWIRKYKERETQGKDFYFICSNTETKKKLGLNRIYNIEKDTFEIGSWLYRYDIASIKPVLGDLVIRSLAFEELGLKKCKIEVRKQNKPVLNYSKSFNPIPTGESSLNYYFELDYLNFKERRDKLLKIFGYDK